MIRKCLEVAGLVNIVGDFCFGCKKTGGRLAFVDVGEGGVVENCSPIQTGETDYKPIVIRQGADSQTAVVR